MNHLQRWSKSESCATILLQTMRDETSACKVPIINHSDLLYYRPHVHLLLINYRSPHCLSARDYSAFTYDIPLCTKG